MSDDVKAAVVRFVAWIRQHADEPNVRVYQHNADDIEVLLTHIDGEAARTAEAVARAREEQREVCARVKELESSAREAVLLAGTLQEALRQADEETVKEHDRAERAEARVKELEMDTCAFLAKPPEGA